MLYHTPTPGRTLPAWSYRPCSVRQLLEAFASVSPGLVWRVPTATRWQKEIEYTRATLEIGADSAFEI